jgi:hypothetical protein
VDIKILQCAAAIRGNTPKVIASGAGQFYISGTGRIIRDHTYRTRPSWKESINADQ